MASGVRFYFGENLGRLTLSQIRDRQAFLANRYGGGKQGDNTSALTSGAAALMAKGDRKEIPLGEVIGLI